MPLSGLELTSPPYPLFLEVIHGHVVINFATQKTLYFIGFFVIVKPLTIPIYRYII
jgi:hypothetical protein